MSQGTSWICHDCPYSTASERYALGHAELADHWLYEHPGGFRGNAPLRSMHASNYGGVYVDAVESQDGARLARSWRERLAGGVF